LGYGSGPAILGGTGNPGNNRGVGTSSVNTSGTAAAGGVSLRILLPSPKKECLEKLTRSIYILIALRRSCPLFWFWSQPTWASSHSRPSREATEEGRHPREDGSCLALAFHGEQTSPRFLPSHDSMTQGFRITGSERRKQSHRRATACSSSCRAKSSREVRTGGGDAKRQSCWVGSWAGAREGSSYIVKIPTTKKEARDERANYYVK
jgi:hypothetical protein